jgi:nucleotide-binding universal stress UspA family protein
VSNAAPLRTIVVPLDGSRFAERALAPAAEVAARANARVVVLTARQGGVVVEPRRYLMEAARKAGIHDPEPVVIEDRLAASAIVTVVEEAGSALACLATHARQSFGQALFGSVAEEVIRRVDAPVLLVGPAVREGECHFDELVVCLDGSELASAIVPVAAAWLRALEASVSLLGVVEASALGDRLSIEAAAERAASELATVAPSVPRHLLDSRDAGATIVEFANSRPRALLALATHGRTGLARLAAGSVMTAVVRGAPCPVLTVRPTTLRS